MRLLILCRSSNAGGGPRHSLTLARGLLERGHSVRIIFTRIGTRTNFMHREAAEVGLAVEPLCYRYPERGWPRTLAGFIESWGPNVLLIDNPERIREVAEWSQRLRSHATRVVFIAHCDGTPDSVLRMIEPHLWKTICVSEKAAGTLKAFSPVVIRNSVCAPPGNGENIRARFGIPASAFVIGYVGRQDENKWGRPARNGPPILFDALQGNEHYLLLAGKDAPHPPSGLEASAKDRIRVWSESVENIGDWYHALDVFVLPSRSEGFPLSPLEALLSGTRVAMTPTSDFPSLLGGAIAFFEYGDVAGMRRAILEAPPAALGQAVITEHLSVGRMIDEYEAAFA